jgi:hypothetical protein
VERVHSAAVTIRLQEQPHIFNDLLKAEIAEKQARSSKYS